MSWCKRPVLSFNVYDQRTSLSHVRRSTVAPSTTCPNGVVCEDLWTVSQHDVPVFLELSDVTRTKGVCIGPSVDHLSAHVEEVDIGLMLCG